MKEQHIATLIKFSLLVFVLFELELSISQVFPLGIQLRSGNQTILWQVDITNWRPLWNTIIPNLEMVALAGVMAFASLAFLSWYWERKRAETEYEPVVGAGTGAEGTFAITKEQLDDFASNIVKGMVTIVQQYGLTSQGQPPQITEQQQEEETSQAQLAEEARKAQEEKAQKEVQEKKEAVSIQGGKLIIDMSEAHIDPNIIVSQLVAEGKMELYVAEAKMGLRQKVSQAPEETAQGEQGGTEQPPTVPTQPSTTTRTTRKPSAPPQKKPIIPPPPQPPSGASAIIQPKVITSQDTIMQGIDKQVAEATKTWEDLAFQDQKVERSKVPTEEEKKSKAFRVIKKVTKGTEKVEEDTGH